MKILVKINFVFWFANLSQTSISRVVRRIPSTYLRSSSFSYENFWCGTSLRSILFFGRIEVWIQIRCIEIISQLWEDLS